MRTCRRCKRELDVWQFPIRDFADGSLSARCLLCEGSARQEYRSSARGLAVQKWRDIQRRCLNADGRHESYSEIGCDWERDDFLRWAEREIRWFRAHFPNEIPSVDRINPDGNYSCANCRIISNDQNRNRARKGYLPLDMQSGLAGLTVPDDKVYNSATHGALRAAIPDDSERNILF